MDVVGKVGGGASGGWGRCRAKDAMSVGHQPHEVKIKTQGDGVNGAIWVGGKAWGGGEGEGRRGGAAEKKRRSLAEIEV